MERERIRDAPSKLDGAVSSHPKTESEEPKRYLGVQPWLAKQASLWKWGGGLREALVETWGVERRFRGV